MSVPNTPEWDDNFTQKIRYMGAYLDVRNNIPLRLPAITFTDSMKLDLGDTDFEMICFGRFHSNSDILIYVPELQMIFTGDLFSNYGRSDINNSLIPDIKKWMEAINWIECRMNKIDCIIDGHGHILLKSDLMKFIDNILSQYPEKNYSKIFRKILSFQKLCRNPVILKIPDHRYANGKPSMVGS